MNELSLIKCFIASEIEKDKNVTCDDLLLDMVIS